MKAILHHDPGPRIRCLADVALAPGFSVVRVGVPATARA